MYGIQFIFFLILVRFTVFPEDLPDTLGARQKRDPEWDTSPSQCTMHTHSV